MGCIITITIVIAVVIWLEVVFNYFRKNFALNLMFIVIISNFDYEFIITANTNFVKDLKHLSKVAMVMREVEAFYITSSLN